MEESNSDSDSKENSVVESGMPKERDEELSESVVLPDIVRERTNLKKSQFRGFYLTQKTLLVDSTTSSLDHDPRKQACSMETENEEILKRELSNDIEFVEEHENEQIIEATKNEVPTIVEEFVNVTQPLEEEDDTTENLDLQINAEDKARIEKDHENPGICNDFKQSISEVKHYHQDTANCGLLEVLQTSDEDISEVASDVQEVVPKIKTKQELRISLESLNSSDEDKSLKEEKPERRKSRKNVNMKHQPSASGNETDISDIIVSDMDYYKIRHQTDVNEEKEYCLSWSPTKFITRMKSFDQSQDLNTQSFKTYDISDIQDNGKETSDEDFSCFESDFMTLEEFLEAYRTNWEFDKRGEKIKIFKTSSIQNNSESEDDNDGNNTESLREHLFSEASSMNGDEIEDLDPDTDSEDFPASYAENPHRQKHSPGCVHFMETTDIGGILAFLPPSKMKFCNNNFEPETFVFQSDSGGEDEVRTEEIVDETERTNTIEMPDMNDTDEDNLSDFKDDNIFENDINLNITDMKIEKKKEAKQRKNQADQPKKDNSSEDEILENFVMSPMSEDLPQFQTSSLKQLEGENSIVKTSQNIKLKNKKRRNRNLRYSRKIEMEEI